MKTFGNHNGEGITKFPIQQECSSELLDGFYSRLCDLDHLKVAFSQLHKITGRLSGQPAESILGVMASTDDLLRDLSEDLRARSYNIVNRDIVGFRDQVVEVALKLILDPVFPTEPPCDPSPESVIQWVARAVERGLTRAYEISIDEIADDARTTRVLETARRRILDADILATLETLLRKSSSSSPTWNIALLEPLLSNITFDGIDRILQQLTALGRQGDRACISCARFGNDVVILWDGDVKYDWVLPAIQNRLREELDELGSEIDPMKAQAADLAAGDTLCVMGYEIHAVLNGEGAITTHYRHAKPRPEPRQGWVFAWLWQWQLPTSATRQPKPQRKSRRASPVHTEVPGDLTAPIKGVLAGAIETVHAAWSFLLGALAAFCAVVVGYVRLRWKFVGAAACGAALVFALLSFIQNPANPASHVPLYPVQGKVFWNEEPAAGALVVFHPQKDEDQRKPRPSAIVGSDGSFMLGTLVENDGAPADSYIVTVSMVLSKLQQSRPSDVKRAEEFPMRFGQLEKTPLSATIEAKSNELPAFQLKGMAPPKKIGAKGAGKAKANK